MSGNNGYILVDKPKGWTSFDVVAKTRGLVRAANRQATAAVGLAAGGQQLPKRVKVGHTGTLDPQATGLLVILIGNYTKRATELTKLDKTYEVTMKLGQISTTADEEGDKTVVSTTVPEEKAVLEALQSLQGHIMQTPPIYSAIKINGQRAYDLARKGQQVKLDARPVHIYSNTLTSYAYPIVKFTSEVSSGTYIRSLVEDAGKLLGTGAYMADLRRTRVGRFRLEDAVTVKALQTADLNVRELPDDMVA
jgi:tRNA pseudouridine55 synthase